MEIIMVFMEMVKHLGFNGVYEISSLFSPVSSFSLNKDFDSSRFSIDHREAPGSNPQDAYPPAGLL